MQGKKSADMRRGLIAVAALSALGGCATVQPEPTMPRVALDTTAGTIVLALSSDGTQLRIRVRNPAPDPATRGLPLLQGAGHAQRNIAHRLAWRFGPAARMTGAWADGYYACEITVPVQ